jgi:hypothetical protein
LITWLQETHNVSVSQGTISLTFKCSAEILAKKEDVNRAAKRQWTVKYPLMETALYRWFLKYQWFLSTNPVPEDEVEADDSQKSIPVKATEALQCASLLQQFWMQQDIVDHEMFVGIQTVKDKISIMRSSKLVQKPISEYFSKV